MTRELDTEGKYIMSKSEWNDGHTPEDLEATQFWDGFRENVTLFAYILICGLVFMGIAINFK